MLNGLTVFHQLFSYWSSALYAAARYTVGLACFDCSGTKNATCYVDKGSQMSQPSTSVTEINHLAVFVKQGFCHGKCRK